jgi:hypothetical protein
MTHTIDILTEAVASELRATSRAFTQACLYHAVLRARPELRARWSLERFCETAIARRLRKGPISGLLPIPSRRRPRIANSGLAAREWEAYFPAAILLVDRPSIVDLFAASGVLVQARIAVVSIDGSPKHVISWLSRAIRRGHRAPVGYLHDERTVLYPFLFEPLASLVDASRGEPITYRDLGIGPGRVLRDPLGLASDYAASASDLEELPPCSLVAYAVGELFQMLPPDPMLVHTRPGPKRVA